MSATTDLGPFLADVAEACGLDVALTLAHELGGQMVRFHAAPGEESRAVRAVGLEAARAIGALIGGDEIYVPKLDKRARAVRDREIRRLYDQQGLSVNQLARRYKLSGRRVSMILGEVDAPASAAVQYSLF